VKTDVNAPEAPEASPRRQAPRMVFSFEDLRDMSNAALRAAGVTVIRPLPEAHLARYFDSCKRS